MNSSIKLGKLYELIQTEFPKYDHDEDIFLESIFNVFKIDPLRTYQQKLWVENERLELELLSTWPLGDFTQGCFEYMKSIGLEERKASDFTFKLNSNEYVFSQN